MCESKCLNVICLVKIITIIPNDPFYDSIFSHVLVSGHCIFFKKKLSFEMHFKVSVCFQTFI